MEKPRAQRRGCLRRLREYLKRNHPDYLGCDTDVDWPCIHGLDQYGRNGDYRKLYHAGEGRNLYCPLEGV